MNRWLQNSFEWPRYEGLQYVHYISVKVILSDATEKISGFP